MSPTIAVTRFGGPVVLSKNASASVIVSAAGRSVADGGLPVGVRVEGRGDELLDQAADRLALGAHAALFDDHVALLVELAEHRLEEALGLEIGEQLELVGGQRVEVAGGVGAGGGVQPDAALAATSSSNSFVVDERWAASCFVLEGREELLDLVLVGLDARRWALVGLIGGLQLFEGAFSFA